MMRAFLFSAFLLLSSLFAIANAESIAVPAQLESCLLQAGSTQDGSTTILPDDALYNQTASTLIFNLQFSNRQPAAIAMVEDEAQIKKVLSCAR